MKILLVDHNQAFSDVLTTGLKVVGGHSVDSYATAAEALAAIARERYALALVEYTSDGREFLYEYREVDPLLAVVVLTSLPSQESAVEFLRGGAAALAIDYIQKPEPDLIARLGQIIDQHFSVVSRGDWSVDRKLRQVSWRGRPVRLSPTEIAMFTYFMLHPYEEVQHDDLWHAARGETLSHEAAVTKSRAAVSRLRARLEEAAGREVVQSRHMGGFRFVPSRVAEVRFAEDDVLR